MTLRNQIRRKGQREDVAVRGPIEHRDMSSDEINQIRRRRQHELEKEQPAGPDDGREMFKLAEEAGRCMAPVNTDLNPGNPEFAGLLADSQGTMQVDDLANGDNVAGDMADLMVSGDTKGGLTGFLEGGDEDNGGLL